MNSSSMNKRQIDDDNICSFYLERKKRPCRMKKVEGMAFCPHHSHLGNDKDEMKGARIPCPYDSSHFCYETKLQKHLKKCNARQKDIPEYFIENINNSGVTEDIKVSLNDISDDDLILLITKIRKVYDECNIPILENNSLHSLLESEMEKSDDGLNNFKHMKQQSSLLSLMENHGFLSNESCFIEFGAGKGQLMYWVVKTIPERDKCTFVLIDKSAQRHKSDNKFKGAGLQIKRIRIDIQHLHLGKCIKLNADKVIGISKHLCGYATGAIMSSPSEDKKQTTKTDCTTRCFLKYLALRCLTNTLEVEKESKKEIYKAKGIIMALCCHHRCTWNSYVGKEFLKDKGFSELDFKLMCCIASWATCGLRKSDLKNKGNEINEESEENDPSHLDTVIPNKNLNRYIKLNLKHEERELIGLQCKRLIDAGRMDYLVKEGYQAKLVAYIDKCISLENVAIVAIYKSS